MRVTGFNSDALVLPKHQVFRGSMVPVFQAVKRAQRKPLVKQVILSVVIRKSIGIIHQAHDGLYVKFLPPFA